MNLPRPGCHIILKAGECAEAYPREREKDTEKAENGDLSHEEKEDAEKAVTPTGEKENMMKKKCLMNTPTGIAAEKEKAKERKERKQKDPKKAKNLKGPPQVEKAKAKVNMPTFLALVNGHHRDRQQH